jgi:hypothetical protein
LALAGAQLDLGVNAADLGEGDDGARLQCRSCRGPGQVAVSVARCGSVESEVDDALQSLIDGSKGVKPLSLQWMQRQRNKKGDVEHFGFLDGTSNPVLNKARRHALLQPGQSGRDTVRLPESGRQVRRHAKHRN